MGLHFEGGPSEGITDGRPNQVKATRRYLPSSLDEIYTKTSRRGGPVRAAAANGGDLIFANKTKHAERLGEGVAGLFACLGVALANPEFDIGA